MKFLALVCIALLDLKAFMLYSEKLIEQMQSASHTFKTNPSDCPKDLQDYWYCQIPEYCIPPPTDHNADFLRPKEAPLAICLFLKELQDPEIKLIANKKEYTCSYF